MIEVREEVGEGEGEITRGGVDCNTLTKKKEGGTRRGLYQGGRRENRRGRKGCGEKGGYQMSRGATSG